MRWWRAWVLIYPCCLFQAAAVQCDGDFFQDAAIVFTCSGSGGGWQTTTVYIQHNSEIDVGVPKGTLDLQVNMSSDAFEGDLDVYDPVAGVWVKDHLRRTDSQVAQGHWQGPYKGVPVQVQATQGTPTREQVSFSGPLPTTVTLRLKSLTAASAEFNVSYYYGPSTDPSCISAVPVGCRRYDPLAARETVVQWSRWAMSKHATEASAWNAMGSEHAVQDGGIPSHRWCALWEAWPAAPYQPASCQAVFRLLSATGSQAAVVDRSRFTWAYELDQIANFSARCCSRLRMTHALEAEAWLHLSKDGDAGLWAQCSSIEEASDYKAPWFQFLDINGKPDVQADEFHDCWMSSEACPRYSYIRTQAILFRCRPEHGRAPLLLGHEHAHIADVPAGIQGLSLEAKAERGGISMALVDTRGTQPNGDDGAAAPPSTYATRAGGTRSGASAGSFEGAHLSWSGDEGPMPKSEMVVFRDPTPAQFAVEASINSSQAPAKEKELQEAEVVYSYAGFTECPGGQDSEEPFVPVGCAYRDPLKALPTACFELSKFLVMEHPTAGDFWGALLRDSIILDNAMSMGVPFYRWRRVWSLWPNGVHVGEEEWQECFHWADADHDGYISSNESASFFHLEATRAEVEGFCGDLCHEYPNENALWATWSNGRVTLPLPQWAQIWTGGGSINRAEVTPELSYHFMDKDGDGAVIYPEFLSCYSIGGCRNGRLPLIGGLLVGAGAALGAAGAAFMHRAGHHEAPGGHLAIVGPRPAGVGVPIGSAGSASQGALGAFFTTAAPGFRSDFNIPPWWVGLLVALCACFACVLLTFVFVVLPVFRPKHQVPTVAISRSGGFPSSFVPADDEEADESDEDGRRGNPYEPGFAAAEASDLSPVSYGGNAAYYGRGGY